jgi:hypothetical protein
MVSTDFGFASCNPNELRSHKGEQSRDQSRDHAQEPSQITFLFVRQKGFAVLPVPETNPLLAWNAPEIYD